MPREALGKGLEAEELPRRCRFTRTSMQHLHPPFHSTTDLAQPNQTRIRALSALCRASSRPDTWVSSSTTRVARNMVPIFYHRISLDH